MNINSLRALRAQGQHEEARLEALAILDASPDDATLLYETACLHDYLGLEVEAIPFYRRAIAAGLEGDDRRGAFLGLGSTCRTLGRHEEALAVFDEGQAQFPEAEDLRVFRAMALHNVGRSKEAIESLLGVIARTSADPSIVNYRRAIELYAQDIERSW